MEGWEPCDRMPKITKVARESSAMIEAEIKVVKVIQTKVIALTELDSKTVHQVTSDDAKDRQELRLEVERLYTQFAKGAMKRRKDRQAEREQIVVGVMEFRTSDE